MSPVERALVERKLGQLAERLGHLDRYSREGWEAYQASFERRKASEKLLQEAIEAAIDERRVFDALGPAVALFRRYIAAIRDGLA